MDDDERVLVLTADLAAARQARDWAAEVLAEWSLDTMAADIQLILSELVANTVIHTEAAESIVGLRYAGDHLRVDAYDAWPTFEYHFDPDPSRPSGLGLAIVANIATRWGIAPHLTGKSVWCEVAVSRPAS